MMEILISDYKNLIVMNYDEYADFFKGENKRLMKLRKKLRAEGRENEYPNSIDDPISMKYGIGDYDYMGEQFFKKYKFDL